MTASNSTIAENSTVGSAGEGGGIFGYFVTLMGSTVRGNSSAGSAGGVFSYSRYSYSVANIDNSHIIGNSAGSFGGEIVATR